MIIFHRLVRRRYGRWFMRRVKDHELDPLVPKPTEAMALAAFLPNVGTRQSSALPY